MTNVFDMASEDADAKSEVAPSDQGKASVARLAARSAQLANELAVLEQAVKDKKKELQRIDEQDLPEAMDAIGMSEFTLTDGTKISVKTFYTANITAENKPEAFKWLDDNGHGGIIKTQVNVAFGRGDLEVAKAFMDFTRTFEGSVIEPELDQSVFWSTLRKFVEEQITAGNEDLDRDLFGVYIGRKATVKAKK